jgi:hypothetical protein
VSSVLFRTKPTYARWDIGDNTTFPSDNLYIRDVHPLMYEFIRAHFETSPWSEVQVLEVEPPFLKVFNQ